jgi:hypothetical protein
LAATLQHSGFSARVQLLYRFLASQRNVKIKADNPQFSHVQVSALIGFAVADYCEYNAGKLS